MIIVMKPGATKAEFNHVVEKIKEYGFQAHPIVGTERTVIGCVGDERSKTQLQSLEVAPGVESVMPILKPFKLASKEMRKEKTVVKVGKYSIGGSQFVVMAGPCSVETREQILKSADIVKKAGAQVLRGGAFKPTDLAVQFSGA